MPGHRLRRSHVLKTRGLLEEHYQRAIANRMLSALRGVLKECCNPVDEHRGEQGGHQHPGRYAESEPRGRPAAGATPAFLAMAYSCGFRRSEAVAIDCADLDVVSGELRVPSRQGPQAAPSHSAALRDWLQARGSERARSSALC